MLTTQTTPALVAGNMKGQTMAVKQAKELTVIALRAFFAERDKVVEVGDTVTVPHSVARGLVASGKAEIASEDSVKARCADIKAEHKAELRRREQRRAGAGVVTTAAVEDIVRGVIAAQVQKAAGDGVVQGAGKQG